MGNFQICLDATAPLLLYLAAGYLARRLKQIDSQDVSRFNSVVFNFFLTVNQFKSIYFSDLSTAVRPGLILFSALGVLTSCGIGLALSSKLLPREQRGVMTQGIFRSNFVLIGLYIAETLVPDGSVGSVAVLGAIVIPLFNVLAVVVLSLYGGGHVSFRSIFIKVQPVRAVPPCLRGHPAAGTALPVAPRPPASLCSDGGAADGRCVNAHDAVSAGCLLPL